jgi:hypothetical protein
LADLRRRRIHCRFPVPARVQFSTRGGKLYDPRFGTRVAGSGPYAWMLGRRFEAATTRLGLGRNRLPLRCDLFRPPGNPGEQLRLF